MKLATGKNDGYTLIELVTVIVIAGILVGIATLQFGKRLEKSRFEATVAEMEVIASAIVGHPQASIEDHQFDFGYVGDIGAFPPDLNALVVNPGYATWKGPYISNNFRADDFKKDGWGTEYIFMDTLLRSIGSGENIDRIIAPSLSGLFSNNVTGYIRDAGGRLPGDNYKDSLSVILTYPDGSGGLATVTTIPDRSGRFSFFGIPVGNHRLAVVYLPDIDTMVYNVGVMPGRDAMIDIISPADLW